MASRIDPATVNGWGADLDRALRPAVPMERTPPRLNDVDMAPSQQPVEVEILHSIERPGVTPVFGSALPPHGLSGWIRRRAFRHSENNIGHWMLLLAADRVDVVQHLFRRPRH